MKVKEESVEDVVMAALEAEDLDLDEELSLENSQGSSQGTVDEEEAERLRKMSRSH